MRFNQVVLAGRLTADPVAKNTPGGTFVCEMRVAYDQGSGDKKTAGYVNVSAFQKTGEAVQKYMKKGSAVLIGGRLDYQEWEKDGQKRNKLVIIAHDVQFVDKKSDGEDAPRNDTPAW